jgi:hypothetical protein
MVALFFMSQVLCDAETHVRKKQSAAENLTLYGESISL